MKAADKQAQLDARIAELTGKSVVPQNNKNKLMPRIEHNVGVYIDNMKRDRVELKLLRSQMLIDRIEAFEASLK